MGGQNPEEKERRFVLVTRGNKVWSEDYSHSSGKQIEAATISYHHR